MIITPVVCYDVKYILHMHTLHIEAPLIEMVKKPMGGRLGGEKLSWFISADACSTVRCSAVHVSKVLSLSEVR